MEGCNTGGRDEECADGVGRDPEEKITLGTSELI
jgi:hypothetical protein